MIYLQRLYTRGESGGKQWTRTAGQNVVVAKKVAFYPSLTLVAKAPLSITRPGFVVALIAVSISKYATGMYM